jgi:hypothetical protein
VPELVYLLLSWIDDAESMDKSICGDVGESRLFPNATKYFYFTFHLPNSLL